ncbi:MAG: hypothetical protein RIT45_3968 [Pseudomonadota bacterium]|jgi:Spy/CpxP family protein refolding chaperone
MNEKAGRRRSPRAWGWLVGLGVIATTGSAVAAPPPPPPPPPGVAAGQPPPPPPHDDEPDDAVEGADGARWRERIRALRARVLRQDVGLDEATARRVEGVFDRARRERREVEVRARRAMQAMHLLLEADSADQDAYRQAVDAVLTARAAAAARREAEFAALRATLTPKQSARLLMSLGTMRREMGRLMHDARREALERRARRMLERGGR